MRKVNFVDLIIVILVIILVADIALIIKKHNEHFPIVSKCSEYVNEKHFTEAIEYAKNHADIESPALWSCAGDAYYNLGNISYALDAYKRAQQLQESFWHRYYNSDLDIHIYTSIARILEEKKEYDEAIMYYRKALKSMKENRKVRSEYKQEYKETLLKIADILKRKGELEEAEEYENCAIHLCREI